MQLPVTRGSQLRKIGLPARRVCIWSARPHNHDKVSAELRSNGGALVVLSLQHCIMVLWKRLNDAASGSAGICRCAGSAIVCAGQQSPWRCVTSTGWHCLYQLRKRHVCTTAAMRPSQYDCTHQASEGSTGSSCVGRAVSCAESTQSELEHSAAFLARSQIVHFTTQPAHPGPKPRLPYHHRTWMPVSDCPASLDVHCGPCRAWGAGVPCEEMPALLSLFGCYSTRVCPAAHATRALCGTVLVSRLIKILTDITQRTTLNQQVTAYTSDRAAPA